MASLAEMKKNGGAVANAQDNPVKHKIALLEKRKELLGSGASGSLVVDREIRAAGVMLMNSRDLQNSSPDSFYTAVSIAINSGIGLCNGRGYLVAYKGKCSFVPGWKGLVDLVARTNRGIVWTGVVYKGDRFDYALGDSPFVKHLPEGDSDNWKEATHVYAIGRIKGQDWPIVEVWTIAKVIKHLNKYNKVGSSHYALKDDNNMEMYARKVALLQVIKYMPQSQDLETAILADAAAEEGKGMVIDGNFTYVEEPAADSTEQQVHPANTGDHNHDSAAPTGTGAPVFDESGAPIDDVKSAPNGQQTATPQQKLQAFRNRLKNANDVDMLDADADLIRTFPEFDQDDLTAVYKQRRAELTGDAAPDGQQASAPKARARAQGGLNLE